MIGVNERRQHPRIFKGDGYRPKTREDARLRQTSEAPEQSSTACLGAASAANIYVDLKVHVNGK